MKNIYTQGRWNRLEKEKFLQSIARNDFSWTNISRTVGTRSPAQCRSHYQKMIIGERIKKASNIRKGITAVTCINSIASEKVEKLSLDLPTTDSSTEDRPESINKSSPVFIIEKESFEITEECLSLELYPELDQSQFEYYNF